MAVPLASSPWRASILAWTWRLWLIVIGTGWGWPLLTQARLILSRDQAGACLHSAYRDPVTGRDKGRGSIRITWDGTIIRSSGSDAIVGARLADQGQAAHFHGFISSARGDRNALRPLKHHGTAEFAMLSQSFLDMAGALNTRSDFVTTFAAHVSHELKSPLTSIDGAAELLRDDIDAGENRMPDAEKRHFLDNIVADAKRLAAVAHRLRELALAEAAPNVGSAILRAAIDELRRLYPSLAIGEEGDLDRAVPISADNLRIVLCHLVDNALHHGATRIDLAAEILGDGLDLVVRDDGSGISPNNRSRIFDSFFTTRRDTGGTGMGLSITRAMLVAHGGAITLLETSGGAAFRISWPIDRVDRP